MAKTKKQKKPKKIVKSLEEIPELLKETPPENIKVEGNVSLGTTSPAVLLEVETPEQDEILEDTTSMEEKLETVEELKDEPITNINNCEYRLTLQFNNETYDCFTNNLKIGILSFAREVLTEMFIKIEKGSAIFEKKLNLTQAKMLFNDMQSLEIFLETFYGLYGRPTTKQLM